MVEDNQQSKSTTIQSLDCMHGTNQLTTLLFFLGHSFYDPTSIHSLSESSFLCLTQVHTANVKSFTAVLSSKEAKDTVYGKSQHEKYTDLVPVESF